jgi:hypothetical protein
MRPLYKGKQNKNKIILIIKIKKGGYLGLHHTKIEAIKQEHHSAPARQSRSASTAHTAYWCKSI